MSYGTLWQRWVRGVSWTWINERYRARVPDDLAATVMTLESQDRFHAKQGRSTARVVLIRADPPLAVYLKRHFRLPWPARVAALVDPAGKHSPAAAEWDHLEQARALGIDVPEVVAAGEHIGPRAQLQSFVMIAELAGCEAVNELLPRLVEQLDAMSFEALKRSVIAELARITATLHAARVFHKDLYLCHFFLDRGCVTSLAECPVGDQRSERVSKTTGADPDEACWPPPPSRPPSQGGGKRRAAASGSIGAECGVARGGKRRAAASGSIGAGASSQGGEKMDSRRTPPSAGAICSMNRLFALA